MEVEDDKIIENNNEKDDKLKCAYCKNIISEDDCLKSFIIKNKNSVKSIYFCNFNKSKCFENYKMPKNRLKTK